MKMFFANANCEVRCGIFNKKLKTENMADKGLKLEAAYSESKLENAIISKLQSFMLDLCSRI